MDLQNSQIIYYAVYFFGWLGLLTSCSNSLEDIEKITLQEESNVEHATDVQILYSDSAVIRMRIVAPKMRNIVDSKEPKREFPQGVYVEFFDANQSQSSQLTANYAEYMEKNKEILLRDSIVIWNYRNERLETEELVWSERFNKIYSEKFVKITTPSEVIEGYGFSSDMEFTQWEIDSVSGIFDSKTFVED